MRLTIRIKWGGKVLEPLEFSEVDTFDKIKQGIYEITGVEQQNQKLFHKGKLLKVGRSDVSSIITV